MRLVYDLVTFSFFDCCCLPIIQSLLNCYLSVTHNLLIKETIVKE